VCPLSVKSISNIDSSISSSISSSARPLMSHLSSITIACVDIKTCSQIVRRGYEGQKLLRRILALYILLQLDSGSLERRKKGIQRQVKYTVELLLLQSIVAEFYR